jgi:hypothetical protein
MGIRSLTTASISTGAKRNKVWDQTAALPKGYEAIGTAMGTGSSGTITFSSIPSTYKHLQLRIFNNTSRVGAASGSGRMRFNGDAVATNYYTHYIYTTGAGTANGGANNENYGMFYNGDTTTFAASIVDILDYADTSKRTTARIYTGFDKNDGAGQNAFVGLFWNNTAAINEIVLFADGGYTWGSNSRFSLYGIKG